MDIRRIAAIKNGEDTIGNRTRVKVVKNKMAPPFKEVEFDILYGEGISQEGELIDLASDKNIIEKSGTWYTYKDERIGQGRENARQWMKEHPADAKKIREEVLKKSGIAMAKPEAAPTAAQAQAQAQAAAKAKAAVQAATAKPASK